MSVGIGEFQEEKEGNKLEEKNGLLPVFLTRKGLKNEKGENGRFEQAKEIGRNE